jgi:hypothetical protein
VDDNSINQEKVGRDRARSVEEIAGDIIGFAARHNLKIHPGQEALKFAALVHKRGGCPCVPGRNHCPCEFALADIEEINRCRCGLFANDAYIEEYYRLTGEGTGGRKSKG